MGCVPDIPAGFVEARNREPCGELAANLIIETMTKLQSMLFSRSFIQGGWINMGNIGVGQPKLHLEGVAFFDVPMVEQKKVRVHKTAHETTARAQLAGAFLPNDFNVWRD